MSEQPREQKDEYLPNPSIVAGVLSTRKDREEAFNQMSKDDLLRMAAELLRQIAVDVEWHDAIEKHIQQRDRKESTSNA